VVKVDRRDDTGGYLKTRLDKVKELEQTIPNAFWTNQYENPENAEAHYQLTGAEIAATFDSLDYAFIGVSTGGTLRGLSRRLRECYPQIRIVAVDAVGSVAFGGPARKRRLPGLGSSIRPPFLDGVDLDEVVLVREDEAAAACWALREEHQLSCGGSTGSVFAAIRRFAPWMSSDSKVLFLCADGGAHYRDTLYSPSWCEQALGWSPRVETETATGAAA
jgi:cysteine synthase A